MHVRRVRLAAVLSVSLVASTLSGCIGIGRAYFDRSQPPVISPCKKYFRGVRADRQLIRENAAMTLPVLIDMPLSFIADVLLLPVNFFGGENLEKQCMDLQTASGSPLDAPVVE
jgi:uncharacterized protein YceK